MEFNLKNKVALITGASSGIGKAIKETLESEGCNVINWDILTGYDLMLGHNSVTDVDILINNIG